MSAALLADRLRPLFDQARAIYAGIIQVEDAIRRDYDRLFESAWQLGKVLTKLKEAVGHGRWLFWLGANWEELGEDKAQRCMQFFAANARLSNPANLRDFNVDSIRKLLGGYMPAKLRPELPGDQQLSRVITFDAGTNRFSAFFQRIKEGHAQPPPWETVAPQARLIIEGLRELYGPDHIQELLQ